MKREVQAIKCKCGKIFAACRVPECYEDAEWQKDMRKYVKLGCTVEMIDAKSFNFGRCDCRTKKQPDNQSSLF